jgi:hypothetical protein
VDSSANDQEAGKVLDATVMVIDGADGKASKDVRDPSGVDTAVLDANIAVDVRDGAIDRLATKDGAADRGEVLDAPQAVDTEIAGIDAPSDVGLAGLGTCASPIDIPAGRYQIDVPVSTAQAGHVLNFPCGSNGADIVMRVHVTTQQPQLFYADTFGAAWNTMLFFSDTCDQPKAPTGVDMVVCSDDACGTSQSQVVALLNYGYHYLIVSGANGESGDVTVHVQRALLGNGTISSLPVGAGSVQGNTSGIDRSELCQTSGAKDNYWWQSCPDDVPGAFIASTCGGATWDTELTLQIPRTDIIACNDNDDNCGMQSSLNVSMPAGAGIQVLTVGGTTGNSIGNYTFTYTRP